MEDRYQRVSVLNHSCRSIAVKEKARRMTLLGSKRDAIRVTKETIDEYSHLQQSPWKRHILFVQ
eukprot:scaffold945_cov103-Skeletonema_dohrnii-CCMP3373.AAC.4